MAKLTVSENENGGSTITIGIIITDTAMMIVIATATGTDVKGLILTGEKTTKIALHGAGTGGGDHIHRPNRVPHHELGRLVVVLKNLDHGHLTAVDDPTRRTIDAGHGRDLRR